MSTWSKATAELAIRVQDGMAWAKYDYAASRVAQGADTGTCATTADQLAAWDTEALIQVPAMITGHEAEVSKRSAAAAGITARFSGTCAKSGARYGKGARIESTMYGWALVGAELDINYNMSREDSPL